MRIKVPKLTHAQASELFYYDDAAGMLRWRVTRGRAVRHAPAGSVSQGYYLVDVVGERIFAHRLVWFYHYQVWPAGHLDHIDGNLLNNRIGNLREATASENARNRKLPATNRSGYKGVSWKTEKGKWCAQIWIGDKRKFVGYFDTPEAAHKAYCAAAQSQYGEFFRAK